MKKKIAKHAVGIALIASGLLLCACALMASDTYTSHYVLRLPDLQEEDNEIPWGLKYNNNFNILDEAVYAIATSSGPGDVLALKVSTGALEASKVNKSGDTMTGPLVVNGNITASRYFGDGSALTGISASAVTGVLTSTMTGSAQKYYMDSALDASARYVMYSSFPITGNSVVQTGYLTGDQLAGTWVTPAGYPNAEYVADGTWNLNLFLQKILGSADLQVYADIYNEAGTEFVGRTSYTPKLASNVITPAGIWISTGVVKTGGARYAVKIYTHTGATGTSPKLKLYFGESYAANFAIPINPLTQVPASGNTRDINLGEHVVTVSTLVISGMNANIINATTFAGGSYYGDGSNLTGVAGLAASNYWTGLNQFTMQTHFDDKIFTGNVQMEDIDPNIASINHDAAVVPLRLYGLNVNLVRDYAYNWANISTSSISAYYYTAAVDNHSRLNFDQYGLSISSGLRAGMNGVTGAGGVNIIGTDGKIPALTSAYFANMDGSAITGLSTVDATKLPLAGGTMTGSLVLEPTSIGAGQVIFRGAYPHSMQFNNQSATSNVEFLGEVQFLQSGTGKRRIIGFGDDSATYPKEIQIGADTTSLGANVRITGASSLNPDLFVSSWTSVGVNRIPNAAYKLDVNGNINAAAFYQNGTLFTGGGGGDNLGSHVATMTITAGYGISASTIVTTGKVGIGMTPTNTLDIQGNITDAHYIHISSASGSSIFEVSKNGNVGISTESPKYLLDVAGATQIQGQAIILGSATINGALSVNGINNIGTSTATFFYGNGSNLTGISAGGVASFRQDNFYSNTNGSQTTFTLTNIPLPNSLHLTKNGVSMAVTTDYTLASAVITMLTAPASSTTLVANYAVADSSFNILSTTNTWTAPQTLSSATINAINLPTRDKITFANEFSNVSIATPATFSTTRTAGFVCITGSTLTITTQGNSRIEFNMNGVTQIDVANALVYYGLTVDGVQTPALYGQKMLADGSNYPVSISYKTAILSAGSHSICTWVYTLAGTTYIYNDATRTNQFSVKEIR